MAGFKASWQKVTTSNETIRLCYDSHHAWFIERQKDREQHLNPLGGFSSVEYAKSWADEHYPGGEWQQL